MNGFAEKYADNLNLPAPGAHLIDAATGEKIDYATAWRTAGRVYAYLKSKGLGKGDFVLINLPRGIKPVMAIYGVWRAGAAFAIVEDTYPRQRIDFIKHDCGCRLELNAAAWKEAMEMAPLDGWEDVGEHDAAYVIYTSGTTGNPKGVVHEYGNLDEVEPSYVCGERSIFAEDDFFALVSPINFVASIMLIILFAMRPRGRFHVLDYVTVKTPSKFRDYLDENAISAVFLSPSYVRALGVGSSRHLKRVMVGAEPANGIDPGSLDFFNVYGMSEGGFATCVFKIEREYDMCPVGRCRLPIKTMLVDADGREVPAGEVGELCFENRYVRGYVNLPEESARAFKNGFYHTGDLARLDANGDYVVVGRASDMVKINGNRVEPAEVEVVAKAALGVDWCAARGFEDDLQAFLAVYYTADIEVDADMVRAKMAEKLPEYMLPRYFVKIAEAPLKANGKLDRKALPRPTVDAGDGASPETAAEKAVFAAVSEVTGHARFGIDASFSAIGLTSVGTMKLIVKLGEMFPRPVQLADLKANGTVRKLAAFLSAESGQIVSRPLQADYPITKTQMGVFVECRAEPDSVRYNLPFLMKLDDGIDLDRLETALKAAVDAHPYVKTRLFMNDAGEVRAERRDTAEVVLMRSVAKDEPSPSALVRSFELLGGDLYRLEIYDSPKGKYLFSDFHHIVSDGTSEVIFFRDVDRAYLGEKLVAESYTGYEAALDEADRIKSSEFARAKEYFTGLLDGAETENPLIGDLESDSSALGTLDMAMPLNNAVVAKYCRKNGTSASAFFNAVFGYTMSVYAGREDVVYATVYNGRSDSRFANSMSMFVKTLPVMFNASKFAKTADLVRATGEQLLASMGNDVYSFADLASSHGVNSDVMFVYQGDDFSAFSVGGKQVEYSRPHPDQAQSTLSLEVNVVDGRLRLTGEYDAGRHSRAWMEGFADTFIQVAMEFLIKSDLADVNLVSTKTRALIDELNCTEFEYDRTKTVVDRFRAHAASSPNKVALVYLEHQYTYRELDLQTDVIAAELVRKGAGVGSMIGVLAPRSEWIVILTLAALKSGAGYLPMDTSYPDERLDLMLEDSGARILITTPELSKRISSAFTGERLMIADLADLEPPQTSNLPKPPEPSDTFVMLYTSGTTGKPKGAVLTHANVMAMAEFVVRMGEHSSNTVCATYGSYGFDSFISDTFPTYLAGGTLHVIPEEKRLDLEWVRDYFNANGVTHSDMTTQVARQFALLGGTTTLKFLCVGGEKLVPLDPPGFRFVNCYGPAECTSYVTWYDVKERVKDVPIGRPNGNTKLYVCDSKGRLLPPNAVGELWIAGPQVCNGYLNRPEKTAEVFVANPYGEGEYARAYRTGDVVLMRSNGDYIFVGRRDGQVKVRGFRIELTEVEEVIRRFPGVKDATVQAFANPSGGKFVAAYVVGEKPIDVEAMNAFIRSEKPPYMVPAVTMQIDAIPLNQNQKVNKRALPKPELKRAEFAEPANDVERFFCVTMGELLGQDRVSATEDFFEIGGSSIVAISFMAKANAKGYPLTYANVFDLRTPRALADFVVSGGKKKENAGEAPLFDFASYDRDAIARTVACNDLDSFRRGECLELGDVLITGATGFLGIHLLAHFLDVEKGRAYCLVRKGKYPSVAERLETMLYYYFEGKYDAAFAERVVVVDGDVTRPESFDQLLGRGINTVFNCAANVKHFSSGTDIEDVNIGGAKAVVEFCLKSGARLVHFSTVSVNGFVEMKDGRPESVCDERTVYVGQRLTSKYPASKMIAELEVFKAVAEKGLGAKVIRLGLLSPREKDGEFQINFRTNAFMGTLRAYATLGCFPYSRLHEPVDTDPIDYGVAAYMTLAKTPDECRLFHATNYDTIPMGGIIRMMNAVGVKVDFVEDDVFDARLDEALADTRKARILQPLMAYRGVEGDSSLVPAPMENEYTTQVLARMGFFWKAIGEDYVEAFVKALKTLGFFDVEGAAHHASAG